MSHLKIALGVHLCSALLALTATTACSSGSGTQAVASPVAPSSVLAPLSVANCPVISGDYICSSSSEDRARGREDVQFRVRQGRNEAGQPTLAIRNGRGDQTYIADGNVQTETLPTSTIQYVVSCQADSVALHTVNGSLFDTVSIFRVVDDSRIRIHVRGTMNGTAMNDHRTCVRKHK